MTQRPPTSDSLPPAAAVVGRYVLLNVIGEGAMGVVYAAFDAQLDRKIAIKVLRPTLAKGDVTAEVQARLLREAQAMARLSHPNVVAVHDVGVVDASGSVFVAMEYVAGPTLKDYLRTKPRPWREGLELLRAAGRGLAAAHAAGLVHRDFKPDNVLVGNDGRVRVTDFGIARVEPGGAVPEQNPPHSASLGPAAGEQTQANPRPSRPRASDLGPPSVARATPVDGGTAGTSSSGPLTLTGSILGTVGYMAPEQAFGEAVDARSDQFSFCATLYFTLYGEKPFPESSFDAYVRALENPVRDPKSGADVPGWLRRAVLKGLSYEPADRYASMDELLEALEPEPVVPPRSRAPMFAALGLAALAVLAGGFWYTRSRAALCPSAASELAGTWDPAIHDDVRKAFDATHAPNAADSFARVAKVLDAYGGAWTSMRVEACEASKVRKEQPPELYKLRSECLDRERMELRALTSVLRRADKDVVASSVKAAYGLTAVSWCADVAGLRASPGLPADPEKRARVLEARAELATATSLGLAGKTPEAKARAGSAAQIARDAGDRSTEAEALYALGMSEQRSGDYVVAADDLAGAMAHAYASGNDVTLAHAASLLAFVVGDKLYRQDEGRRMLELAHAGLERVGGSDDVEADVLSTEGLLLVTQGYADRAAPLLERVVSDYRRTLGEHPLTAIHLNNLGYAEHLQGRDAEALVPLTEARAMLGKLYGVERTSSGIATCNLGAAHLALGDGEGRALLAHALEIFDRESLDGYWSAWTLQYLVLAASIDGDTPSALAFGRRGIAIADKLQSAERLVPGTHVATADALLVGGAPDDASEALALCDRALEVQDKVELIAPDKVYDWDALRCRGEALLAQHRPREALAPLERSVTLPRRVMPWDLARAKLALARALLESKGDASRAHALAQEARTELAALPSTKKLVAPGLRQLVQDEGEHLGL